MQDIRKLLDIISESSAGASTAGSVASVPVSFNETQKRIEEKSPEMPKVIEYGNWENSALTTSKKLKAERKKASKIVKSIYGEDVQAEAANPKQQAAIAIAKKKEVAEGKFTVNRKTGAKLDPRTGEELPPKEKPLTMKDMFRQPKLSAPKLTLDDVWRKVEDVVSNIYPDGDPIDHLAPWLEKHGIRDFKIGEILDRAAKKNGYKDLYDYWDSMGDLPLSEQGVAEGYKEPTDAAGHLKMAANIKKMLDDTLADRGDRHGNPDPERLTRAYEYHMQKAKEKSQGVSEGSSTSRIWSKSAQEAYKMLGGKLPKGFVVDISVNNPKSANKLTSAIRSSGYTVEPDDSIRGNGMRVISPRFEGGRAAQDAFLKLENLVNELGGQMVSGVAIHTDNKQDVAEGLNEFAPDGFNGGDDSEEFNPNLAKMAYDDGFTKGAGLADGATLQRAMAINDWDKHDGGIYSQHFAKGFKKGRLDKINFNNKQYNLNLKLMKDGSIRHGEQGVVEGLAPEKRTRLDDLIDAYRDSTDPTDYYDREYSDPEEVIEIIRNEFGDKIASQVEAGAHKMHFPRPGHTDWKADPLGWKKPVDRQTKAGKMYKQDSDFRKNTMKSRYKLSGKSATEDVAEDALEESDLIINPASIGKITRGLVAHEQDRTDHEVEMAKGDLYQAGKNAVRIFELIRDISEEEGLEGWVQEKIIKAADYLNTVREYLEGKGVDEAKMFGDVGDPAEPWNTIDKIVGSKSMQESIDGVSPGTHLFTSETEDVDEGKTGPGLWANIHAKRERIKKGSGERMRKPGSKGAPSAQDFKDAAKNK